MKRNHRRGKRLISIVMLIAAATLACGQAAWAAPPTPVNDVKSQIGTMAPSLCSDPAVKLIVSKVLVANTAIITLTG